MANKAKRIYWAVRGIMTSPPPGTSVAIWEEKTKGRVLPKDHFETVLYFADGPVNLYQIRQWYEPLRRWNEQSPTVILCRSVNSALAFLEECPVPVVYISRIEDIERFVNEQRLRMGLYVNHHQRNFQMMRFIDMLHVYISHGESDKHYMVSGQIKSYDYIFTAGEAAANRLGRFLLNFDVETRTKTIGRPQLDAATTSASAPALPSDDRTVVLYAPTWEGDRPSMSYGSIPSHGVAMVQALVDSGRHRVIVRPHPRTGIYSDAQAEGREKIRQIVEAANTADPTAGHLFDETPNLDWQLAAADVAISDVSAAAIDWLATGKPLVATHPVEPGAVLPEEGYLAELDLLTAEQAADIVTVLDQVLSDEAGAAERMRWATYYFGDITPGVATELWLKACREVVDTTVAMRQARGLTEQQVSDAVDIDQSPSELDEADAED